MSHVEAAFGLSPMQLGMLFHQLSAAHSGVDLEQIDCLLREEIDPWILERAWARVAERHPAFRTRLRWEGLETPIQEVLEQVELPLRVEDYSHLEPAERERRLQEFLREDRQLGFDLSSAPLVRVALFRLGEREHRMVWSFSHVLMDGRSFGLVLRDLFAFAAGLARGEEVDLPALPRFQDHVSHLERRDRTGEEAFWRERLRGFSAPTPVPGARPFEHGEVGGGERHERERRLDREQTRALEAFAREHGLGVHTLLQAAWALLQGRHSGESDVVFGATRACRRSTIEGADRVVGLFINTLPLRARWSSESTLLPWLQELQEQHRATRSHEHTPLVDVQRWSEVPAGTPLFDTVLVFDRATLDAEMKAQGGEWAQRDFRLIERTTFPLALYAYADSELLLKLAYDADRIDDQSVERMLGHLETLLTAMPAHAASRVVDLPLLTPRERSLQLQEWNDTARDFPADRCLHELFEEQVRRAPDRVAVHFEDQAITYRELDERANRLAAHLRRMGVTRDGLVGLFVERSPELLVGVLGVLKAGGAYLPLDPEYPADRIAFMIEDAGARVLLTQAALLPQVPPSEASVVLLDPDHADFGDESGEAVPGDVSPGDLAYVIYTSGSTGKPKGVMLEHRNVVNFFTGMDERIEHDPPGVWLAVTSLSFDISVLELLWTLTRGFQVVVYAGHDRREAREVSPAGQRMAELDFSLFYFSSGEGGGAAGGYRLLMEGARFADQHGFSAVWTPERHFHAFGGLFPNPAVAGAALAAATERVAIRAGSVVLPLHHPIRVAEEWALVDNLSAGRVGISVASGWHPNDFVLAPENHADRRNLMYEHIETIRRLWRGEALAFENPLGERVELTTMPRPVQAELPIWVTTAGSIETYRGAGEAGANLLTHLLGQTFEEVAEKVKAYRDARLAKGFDAGHVTLMLHTFVGDDEDEVRETVREPMKDYLRSAMSLVKNFVSEWTAFSKRAAGAARARGDEFSDLSPDDVEDLLDFSFERYYATSGLFGTPERCLEIVERVAEIGVDEIACLIDFGVETETALAHLTHLDRVRRLAASAALDEGEAYSIPALIRRHEVTHLQCTPSMARLLMADPEAREALGGIRTLMLGGEALPGELAAQVREQVSGRVINMYGPTETTIWSSTHEVVESEGVVPIGRPIANTTFYVVDGAMQPTPIGVAGELLIGGAGVARGYLNRPELTAERFVPDPFGGEGRLYRTGDLARHRPDGVLEFLGRSDHQVKLRGHRIELGEIESVLVRHPALRAAVVMARDDGQGAGRLVAYVLPMRGVSLRQEELAAFAAEALPDFMVPDLFVELAEFPLTPNGKIDRKALPEPDRARREESAGYQAPRTPIEQELAAIWRDVLGVDPIGARDNFFELGGNSLSTIQIGSRIREAFCVDLPLRAIFRTPTIEGVARAVEERILEQTEDPMLGQLLDELEGLPEDEAKRLANA